MAFLLTMKRFFNGIEKTILYLFSDGRCQSCNVVLGKGWHADHIIPFSKGGQTKIKNGQALCPKCNLSKSNKIIMKNHYFNLHPWQKQFAIDLSNRFNNPQNNKFLLHACVGSGKTFASAYAISQILHNKNNFIPNDFEFPNNSIEVQPVKDVKIFCIAPQGAVKQSFSTEFAKFGYNLIHDTSKAFYQVNVNGFCLTYKGVENNYESLKEQINICKHKGERTIVVLDEIHHLAEEKKWGEAVKEAFGNADFILCLTGTPFRHDNKFIPFSEYLPTGIDKKISLRTDYSYSLANGIENKIICGISFRGINVKFENELLESQNDFVSDEDYQYAIYGDSPFVKDTLLEANAKIEDIRNHCNMPNAGGLIVANNITEAEKIYKFLVSLYGTEQVDIIVSKRSNNDEEDDADTIRKIKDFKQSNKKWLVSVKMISEGINIPRLRVCVYLSSVKTRLFVEQVVGRIVRNRSDEKLGVIDMAYFYFPKHEELYKIATEIQDEFQYILSKQEAEYQSSLIDFEKSESIKTEKPLELYKVAERGDSVIVNQGQDLSEFQEKLNSHKEKYGAAAAQDLESTLADFVKSHKLKTEKVSTTIVYDSFENTTDECQELRSRMTKALNSLAYRLEKKTGNPFSECISYVHYMHKKEYGDYKDTYRYDPETLKAVLYAAQHNTLGLV